ncbi:MAG: cell division protein FtsQ/DivIB [Pseudomonadota bacterium]
MAAPAAALARLGAGRRQPGPSRLAFRLRRAWAQPATRRMITLWLPVGLAALAAWQVLSDARLHQAARTRVAHAWQQVHDMPAFRLQGMVIEGAPPALKARIQQAIGLPQGQSALGVDLEVLRARVEGIGAVASARLRVDPAGVLMVEVVPRRAAVLWRDGDGAMKTLAADGAEVAAVARRADRPDLPLLICAGAERAVAEALALLAAPEPAVAGRIRALVRVGERRWDIVLAPAEPRGLPGEGDVRIMLPEEGAPTALARVLAVHYGTRLLERDLVAVDLRLAGRPTLRLSAAAAARLQARRALDAREAERRLAATAGDSETRP